MVSCLTKIRMLHVLHFNGSGTGLLKFNGDFVYISCSIKMFYMRSKNGPLFSAIIHHFLELSIGKFYWTLAGCSSHSRGWFSCVGGGPWCSLDRRWGCSGQWWRHQGAMYIREDSEYPQHILEAPFSYLFQGVISENCLCMTFIISHSFKLLDYCFQFNPCFCFSFKKPSFLL